MSKEHNLGPDFDEWVHNAQESEDKREAARDYSIFIPEMTREEVDKLNLGYTLGDWVTHRLDWPWIGGRVVGVSNEYGEIRIRVECPEEPGIMIFYPPTRLRKTDEPRASK